MNGRLAYFYTFGIAVILAWIAFYVLATMRAPEWSSSTITVTAERQEALASTFRQSWERDPTESEMDVLIDAWVQEEVSFRAGISRGIGSEDVTVRRRVQELLEQHARESAANDSPTDEALSGFLVRNADKFQVDETFTFKQVYFDIESNGIGADAAARFMLGNLQNHEMPENLSRYGDPTGLPVDFDGIGEQEIRDFFGDNFATRLRELPTGQWSGPLRSNIGLHLVYIEERGGGRTPELGEVREIVEREFAAQQKAAAVDELYEQLSREYDVVVQ